MSTMPRARPAHRLARIARIALLLGAGSALPHGAQAQQSQTAIVVSAAPGGAFDLDDARTLSREDLARAGSPDLLGALTRTFAGVTLQDAQGNPWQPNLVHRGFTASPLQGQAQGLAVYLDGTRFNQPFGDTVGFDLLPDAALHAVQLYDASPVYGLNALGGALVLETATGRTAPGGIRTVTLGNHGEREGSVALGGARGAFSYFGAAQYRHDGGWRDYSPSELVNLYADLGLDASWGGVHAKLVAADTDLTGNGVAPVELLAARRSAVFSWPDNTRSRYGRISLHPWLALGGATRIEASLYRQRLKSDSVNGDVADIFGCDDFAGLLCLESTGADGTEDETLLTDANGATLADTLGGEGYGLLNRGALHSRSNGVLVQLVDERAVGHGTNRLAVGASLDRSRSDFATEAELGALTDNRSVAGLGPLVVQADGAIGPVSLEARTRYAGLFIADTLPLGGGVSAEIGLRYNHAQVTLDDRIGTALDGEHSFARFNPGLELDWRFLPGLSLRAGYAETNRAPTPAELSCADETAPCSLANFFVADPPLKQVVARTRTLGASGEANRDGWQIDWSATAYRTHSRDDIQHVASAIRGRAYFRNVGDTRRQGVELNLRGRRGGLVANASYAYTDATYRSTLTLSSPSNPQASEEGTITVLAGDRLPGIPRHSVTASLDYAGTVTAAGAARSFTLGADVGARSGQVPVGGSARLGDSVPGYAVVNLRGSVDLRPGLALFGEIRNLFDTTYETFGTFSEVDEVALAEAPGASDPRAFGPGAPRRWTIGLRTRW